MTAGRGASGDGGKGGFSDMVVICIFFPLAAGEGGNNKEESKIVNGT